MSMHFDFVIYLLYPSSLTLMSVKTLAKTLVTAVVQCITDDDITKQLPTEFTKGISEAMEKSVPGFALATAVTKSLAQAVAPELMGSFIESIEYSKLREVLLTPDPNQLNHDLQNLLKKSALTSIGYIERLYVDKLNAEMGQKSFKHIFIKREQIVQIQDLFKQLKDELAKLIKSTTIHDHVLESPTDCLENLTKNIFEAISLDKNSELAAFFTKHLPFCFDLACKEALKDKANDKEFKAFQIWILENINQKIDKGNTKILAEIQDLKVQKDTESSEKLKSYLETECEALHKKFDAMLVILVRVEDKINIIYNNLNHLIEHRSQKLPHHLTTPPFETEGFLGREDELGSIKQKLFEGDNKLLLVSGEGGVGKTSLASKYYHKYKTYYTHMAWVLSEKDIANALLLLAKPLNVVFEDTAPIKERLGQLLKAMAQLEEPCLLVIDNANELEDLKKRHKDLRTCSNFHLLLTTRITEFKQAMLHKTNGLPIAQALELFKKHYSSHQSTEDELFKEIYEAVGENTLVIELLAKNLCLFHKRSSQYHLADLLADLQQKGLLALSKSQEVEVDYQRYEEAKPEDIIGSMYDLGELSIDEIALLSVFAVLPAESIAYPTIEILLPDTENLEDNLSNLAQKGWLAYNKINDAFKCSPVIQNTTKTKNHNLFRDCQPLLATLKKKLDYEFDGLGTLKNSTYEEAIRYVRYAESVVNNFEQADDSLCSVCERLGKFHSIFGKPDKAILFFEQFSQIAEQLNQIAPKNSEYKYALAVSYERLGTLHKNFGQRDTALEYFGKFKQLIEELSKEYPKQASFKNDLAVSYGRLGSLYKEMGDEKAKKMALKLLKKDCQISKKLFKKYPEQASFKYGLAVSYEKLGDLLQTLEKLPKALELLQKSNQLNKDLFQAFHNQVGFKNGLASSYSKLGDLHKSLKNWDEALAFFIQSNELSEQLFNDYPNQVGFKNGLAISYKKLGVFYRVRDNKPESRNYFKKAEELWEQLVQAFPQYVEFQNNLKFIKNALGDV